jgi:hypothetical protein
MGVSDSKPVLTSDERVARDTAKTTMVQKRKAEIDAIQNQYSTAIVESKEAALFYQVTEKAKQQLDRQGDALVKTDLIAIAIALDPKLKSQYQRLDGMRVSDLNALIRCIIYDPVRVAENQEPQAQKQTKVTHQLT